MIPLVQRRAVAMPASDAILAARIADGDRAALAFVYTRDAGKVYRFALAMCGNAAWAADATQDAFVQLAAQAQAFDAARGALGAWLAGVVRHRLYAQWREARDTPALPDDDADDVDGRHEITPELLLVRRQQQDALWAAVRTLAWPFREALVLVDLQDRSYAEAAAIAGIEINTLRTRLHRARRRLAQALNAQPGEHA